MNAATTIRETLRAAMAEDDRVLLLGESVGRLGGLHGTTTGLAEEFPGRVVDTPLSEAGVVGLAVGLALGGKRPVVELTGGLPRAFQQLVQEASAISAGSSEFTVPLVVRTPYGDLPGSPGEHPESLVAGFDGLDVVAPSHAADAAAMLMEALESTRPTVVLEARSLYASSGSELQSKGEDISLFAYGGGIPVALAAAEELGSSGISAEVVDLRSLWPLELERLSASVRRTARVVLVSGSEAYAARALGVLCAECFLYLESPPRRADVEITSIVEASVASVTY
ncbi:MAG TPA: transketolase C-terminal domain-containing protein [Myxococcota bacterium]|nr:transketolase C-terminal domain-containing protein [Myxococcota bacterium]